MQKWQQDKLMLDPKVTQFIESVRLQNERQTRLMEEAAQQYREAAAKERREAAAQEHLTKASAYLSSMSGERAGAARRSWSRVPGQQWWVASFFCCTAII